MKVDAINRGQSHCYSSDLDQDMIKILKIEQLFNQVLPALYWSFVVCVLLGFVLWNVIPVFKLCAWFSAVLMVTIPRIILIERFQKSKLEISQYNRWFSLFLIGTTLSGIVWGSLALIFVPTGSVGHDFVIVVTLAGLTCTALTSYSSYKHVQLFFLIPAMTQLVVTFLIQGGQTNIILGVFVLLYTLILVESGNRLYNFNSESLEKRFENQGLIQAVLESEEKFRALSEASFEAIILTENGICLEQNLAAQSMFGYSNDEAIGSEGMLWLSPEYREEVRRRILDNNDEPYEATAVRKDGTTFPCEVRGKRINFSGRTVRVTGMRDITERKRFEERIKHMANHDVLTNLPTLRLARDRIRMALERSHRSHSYAVVMYLDLDNFKQVNDSYGHSCGDKLLKLVAQRFLDCVRKSDTLARIGGDEFLIVLADQKDLDGAEVVAIKLVESLKKPVVIESNPVNVSVSVGIAYFPSHGRDPDLLIKKADEAMYQQKNTGKNGFTFAEDTQAVS